MKRNNKYAKKESQSVANYWDFYFSDNKDATTALNLALIEVIPIENMTNLARIEP
jgi:hypothetical protein